MRAQELIDKALRYGDNVSPTSADYLERRRMALSFLRDLVDEIWWLRDWPWKKTDTTVTVPAAAGKVALPANFDSLGNYGGVYRSDGSKVDEVPESVIEDLRAGSAPWQTTDPVWFSLHGLDDTVFLGYIQIPLNPSDVDLKLVYQRRPPYIMDAGDPDSTPAVTGATLTRTGTTVVVTSVEHPFQTYQPLEVSNASETGYDGTGYSCLVTGGDTFQFEVQGTPTSPATADIEVDLIAGDRAVLAVPERFHSSVLLWGLRAKLRESKGDARHEFAAGEYAKGLAAMLREHARAQGSMRQLPGFFGSTRRAY